MSVDDDSRLIHCSLASTRDRLRNSLHDRLCSALRQSLVTTSDMLRSWFSMLLNGASKQCRAKSVGPNPSSRATSCPLKLSQSAVPTVIGQPAETTCSMLWQNPERRAWSARVARGHCACRVRPTKSGEPDARKRLLWETIRSRIASPLPGSRSKGSLESFMNIPPLSLVSRDDTRSPGVVTGSCVVVASVIVSVP